jgi:ATP-dependent DNA helicase RecQ
LTPVAIDLHAVLREYWGYDQFRPLQERVVQALIAGRDVAVIMPTGGGKSLCYQLPAVVLGGTAVVVSPLIALMKDQADQLKQMGIPAAVLNSSLKPSEQQLVMREAAAGGYRLLYLAPERLVRSDTFHWLKQVPLSLFAIDEAHCISEWGHEFRPDYRQLKLLRDHFPDTPIAAFTASATQRVRHDILAQLRLHEPGKFIASFHRANLRIFMRQCDSEEERERLLMAALRAHKGESVIIYAPTIRAVGDTVEFLSSKGIPAVGYHGQMENADRKENQERWMSDEVNILVGTIAFGLGINKPSVRAVIHLSMPKSLEQYYQEAGCAGRDGDESDCILLWRPKDFGLLVHFIDQVQDRDEKQRSWDRYHIMRNFVEGQKQCRHRQMCLHFGETPKWSECGMCDVCAGIPDWVTASDDSIAVRRRVSRLHVVSFAAPDVPVNEELLEYMKAWRRDAAKAAGVPAFFILNDSGLIDLCRKRPRNMQELMSVSGIGVKKAEAYGAAMLAALKAKRV